MTVVGLFSARNLFHIQGPDGSSTEGAIQVWSDIEFTKRKVWVEFSVSDKGTFGPTKTGERRSVDMSLALADVPRLRQLKRTQRAPIDRGEGNAELVFSNPCGTPLDDSRLRKRLDLATDETAIIGHVPNDAGHTYASTLRARCRDFFYVAAQMGHASPKTTMDHYAHLLPGIDQSYADFLDESEADWQRRPHGPEKVRNDHKNPRFYLCFLEPPAGFEPATC